MRTAIDRRRVLAGIAVLVVAGGVAAGVGLALRSESEPRLPWGPREYLEANHEKNFPLGSGFPVTVAIDVELGPDAMIYTATHGRGIWRIARPTS